MPFMGGERRLENGGKILNVCLFYYEEVDLGQEQGQPLA